MNNKIITRFYKPRNLALLNASLIGLVILLNIFFQVFCIPSPWAMVMLTICFAHIIVYPIIEKPGWSLVGSFINGVSLCVLVYCILFLEQMNVYGLFMLIFGIGIVVFIPHFLILQLIWKHVVNPVHKYGIYYFLSGIIICVGIVFIIGKEFKKSIHDIEKFKESNYTQLNCTFMTEKIVGMHIIYHTRFCEYDGWRPPKHEPILIIGLWLNKRLDPLRVDLETRLALYKKFFPNNHYKFDCSCGMVQRENYHEDKLWLK
jgi:hypothetical protein